MKKKIKRTVFERRIINRNIYTNCLNLVSVFATNRCPILIGRQVQIKSYYSNES